MSSIDENVKTFRRVIEEGFSQGKLGVLDECFTSDAVEHQAGIEPSTVEGTKGAIRYLRSAFPDLKLEIKEVVAHGDLVCFRIEASGTHLGQMGPTKPSGRPIKITVMDMCRFKDGRITDHWGVADRLSLMQQIKA